MENSFPLNSDQPFASALARLSKQLLFLAALNKLHVCAKRRGDGHFSTQHNIASIAFSMYSNDRIMSNWKALVFSRARHSLFLRKDILLTNICNQVARKRSLKWLYSSTSNNSIGLFGQRLCRERSERSGGRQRTEKFTLQLFEVKTFTWLHSCSPDTTVTIGRNQPISSLISFNNSIRSYFGGARQTIITSLNFLNLYQNLFRHSSAVKRRICRSQMVIAGIKGAFFVFCFFLSLC